MLYLMDSRKRVLETLVNTKHHAALAQRFARPLALHIGPPGVTLEQAGARISSGGGLTRREMAT